MKYTYKEANRALYEKKFVRYSLLPKNLEKIRKKLEKRGYIVKFVPKRGWAELDFIRDGSMMVLEPCLVVYRKSSFCGFVTPTKLIGYGDFPELEELYKWPFTLKEAIYFLFLLFLIISYSLVSG